MKVLLASLASLSLLLSVGCSAVESTTEAAAPPAKVLKVKIGESASSAKKAHSHNITESRLKKGQMDFEVNASSGAGYKIQLSPEQIKDILGGTTILVNTLEGGMKVQVTASEIKKKKSGW